jgi:hypothetical protein
MQKQSAIKERLKPAWLFVQESACMGYFWCEYR